MTPPLRFLVFVIVFLISMLAFRMGESSLAFSLFLSACIAAIVSTVATRSGRVAGRRILRSSARGWGTDKT